MLMLGRVSTAMVTPFTSTGAVDFETTTKLIQYLIENGSDSLVVCGTTGESPTLSYQEKLDLIQHVVNVVDGRVPVIAGTGTNDTQSSILFTKDAELLGVDGAMLVVPYYNKPNQAGMYAHFKAIAEHTNLPIMLYNIPGRSAVNMNVDTIVELSKIKNIVAVKEASGDILAMSEIIARTEKDFLLYSGDDGLTLPVLALGGAGVISVVSHIAGNSLQQMIHAFNQGNLQQAQDHHHQLLPLIKSLFITPNPTSVKEALQFLGIVENHVRLPLLKLTEKEVKLLENELKKFGLLQ